MRPRITGILATTILMTACGGAGAPAATTAAPATSAAAAAPAATAAATAAAAASGGRTGTLNLTVTGTLSGTMTEVKSVGICTDPTNTTGGYGVGIVSSLSGTQFTFSVTVGRTYKGPGSYTLTFPVADGAQVGLIGPTIRDRWTTGDTAGTGGTLTVAADGSGTVDADLKNGAQQTGAVHVKGTYSCKR